MCQGPLTLKPGQSHPQGSLHPSGGPLSWRAKCLGSPRAAALLPQPRDVAPLLAAPLGRQGMEEVGALSKLMGQAEGRGGT